MLKGWTNPGMFEKMIYIHFQILIYTLPNVKQLMWNTNEEFFFFPKGVESEKLLQKEASISKVI